ncbi:MAG: hypothetical protein U0797_01080 [Gemmataceae bacterium]
MVARNIPGGVGLAYDGANLYVSTSQGLLLTLDPNTGATLNSVVVSGGTPWENGAVAGDVAVPAPPAIVLAGLGIAGLAGYRRRRSR